MANVWLLFPKGVMQLPTHKVGSSNTIRLSTIELSQPNRLV